MNEFWQTKYLAQQYQESIALIVNDGDGELKVSYSSLNTLVKKAQQKILSHLQGTSDKQLLMMVARHSVNSIVYYLAALQLKQVVWWVDKDLSTEKKQKLCSHYKVHLLLDDGKITKLNQFCHNVYPDLAMLITTSGSTGSPSLVRLSYENLNSNCESICQTLALEAGDNVITTLPLHYSFGLSVINTHLNQGATIVLNEDGLMTREFWKKMQMHSIRCLYGVPYIFDMLLKLNLARLKLSSLRFFAVAGGRLSSEKVLQVNQWCIANEKLFFVMYGQTEATARISVLAPDKVVTKPDSIGKAITDGELWLEPYSTEEHDQLLNTGELCYSGPNVMMGLANNIGMLSLPNEHEILRTGDIATCDNDGDYRIVGRLKRFIKIVGQRINLDEIEVFLQKEGHVAVCNGEDDLIRCYFVKSDRHDELVIVDFQKLICNYLSIHHSYCQCFLIDEVPILSSGKINYLDLSKRVLITPTQESNQ